MAHARIFRDDNAGSWCYQLPGRNPVQVESWAAAHSALLVELAEPQTPPPSPATTTRRWRLGRWLA